MALTLGARMRGLLGRRGLAPGHAMYICPCPSIHTFGMQFALDLVFVDKALQVVRIVWDVGPHKMVTGGRGAHAVFEFEAGNVSHDRLHLGEQLSQSEAAPDGVSP